MNFKKLSDQELLDGAHTAVGKERAALVEVVQFFAEVDRRKLYAVTHSSMFAFATDELKLSEGQAQRRIDCARLLCQLPEIESKLGDGRLNLSHATIAQGYFRREKKAGRETTATEKLTLLKELEGKSTREAEKVVRRLSGETKTRSIHIKPDEKQRADFERVRALWAHRFPDGDWTEIFAAMAKLTLTQIDPLLKAERAEKRAAKKALKAEADKQPTDKPIAESLTAANADGAASTAAASGEPDSERLESGEVQYCLPLKPERSRYVTRDVAHAAWRKAQGRCTYVAPGGVRCPSTYALELDHTVPFALGGDSSIANVRVLCRVHNLQKAREVFGREVMARFER